MSYRLRECPLCGGQNIVSLLTARDYHYGNPGEFAQSQCTGCTLAFLDPMYEDEELAALYPSDYYAFTDRFAASGVRRSVTAKLSGLLTPPEHKTRDPKFERPGRMLDIGCGAGWFISRMRDQGWDVKGVEPNIAAAEFGRSKEGLDIFPGSLLDANFPARAFDYVRMNHSFEHMAHPNEILDEVYRILADQGKLMIGVPNRDSFAARVFGRFWYHLALPLHAFTYSVQTLSQMLTKHNFDVEKSGFQHRTDAASGGSADLPHSPPCFA